MLHPFLPLSFIYRLTLIYHSTPPLFLVLTKGTLVNASVGVEKLPPNNVVVFEFPFKHLSSRKYICSLTIKVILLPTAHVNISIRILVNALPIFFLLFINLPNID